MTLGEATGYLERVLEEQERKKREGGGDARSEGEGLNGDNGAASKCPFAIMGGPNPHGEKQLTNDKTYAKGTHNTKSLADPVTQKETTEPKGNCPWPFILLHDFQTGMQDYRSKIVVGIMLCW